jgi:hypothetical protein
MTCIQPHQHDGGATGATELACIFQAMECTFGCPKGALAGSKTAVHSPQEPVIQIERGLHLSATTALLYEL